MSGLEVNKILASIIMAMLIVTIIGHIGDLIVNPGVDKHLGHSEKTKIAYKIDVPEGDSNHSTNVKKEEIIEPISALLVTASLEKGQKIFKKCGTCHSYEKDGANKVGPNLWNIINRPKASAEGFAYSKALVELGGEWNYENIAEFLYKPKKYVKGTKMSFAGLKKVEDRVNLVLFLRDQSDNPVPLP
jgi:cytochrome c|tara:strand:- start:840 stop:1403 length:564 start_codon:yes stop_codon:yes gene_type:complete